MTDTPTTLLFSASRNLRDAACGYAADIESGTEAENAAEDKLHQAARDYAAVANAIDSQGYVVFGAVSDDAVDRLLGPSTTPTEGAAP